MKPKTKILVLLFGLIFPYMGFVMYRVLTHPENPFPKWFWYAAPCYLIVSMAVFVVLRKKFLASAPPRGPMKYEGVKKMRWIFLGLAVIGIVQTPFVIPPAISSAIADHRLIIPFVVALVIRILFIGFFLKIWWETGRNMAFKFTRHHGKRMNSELSRRRSA